MKGEFHPECGGLIEGEEVSLGLECASGAKLVSPRSTGEDDLFLQLFQLSDTQPSLSALPCLVKTFCFHFDH